MASNCTDCRKCEFSEIKNSFEDGWSSPDYSFEDIYCKHPQFAHKYLVETWWSGDTEVPLPMWCPLKKGERMANSLGTEKKKHVIRSSYEMSNICRNIMPITKWEDIEVGEIYHVPPIGTDKRYDVFILEKTNHMVRMKRITNLETGTCYTTSEFKSNSFFWKFMSKHKIKDVSELRTKLRIEAEKDKALYSKSYLPSK